MRAKKSTGGRSPVRFGTSGFRGVLGEAFTFDRAAALVAGTADVLGAPRGSKVVVAYDTRFLGETFAQEASEILAAAGMVPIMGRGPTPTPAACSAVRHGAAAGLIFTASHNPPEYQGLKVVGPDGGAASRGFTDRLERQVAKRLAKGAAPPRAPWSRRTDLVTPYLKRMSRLVSLPESLGPVVFDAMCGTGAGVVDRWFEEHGIPCGVIRGAADPTFGGRAPDPTAGDLSELRTQVLRQKARFGVATDGDADRFSLLDELGQRISESDAVALLVDHLARSGRIRHGVALSIATGTLPEAVARAHGLPVRRVGLGFKALTSELLAGRADVAGEESGGFAWAPLALDKDGIMAAALVAECLASDPRPLSERVRGLHSAHGEAVSGRGSVAMDPARRQVLRRLTSKPPKTLAGQEVIQVERGDGLHLRLGDGGFLMWRASGTEPLLRIYAEAPSPKALAARLRLGRACLEG